MLDNAIKTLFLGPRHSIPATNLRILTSFLSAITLLVLPGTSPAAPEDLPAVIMVEIPGVTTNDVALYRAIRAQLSAASLRLDRLTIDDSQFISTDPLGSASKLAADKGGDMVFWIKEEGTVYTIFFYNKHASERRISTRELDLVSESELSRSDTIGNALSSIIEESIRALGYARASAAPNPPPPRTPPPLPPPQDRKRTWLNIFTVYSGSFFTHRSVTHGVRIGLELLSIERIAIALSYTYNLPLEWNNERYQLTLTSRNIETSIAGRLFTRFLDFRLGLAWSVDLRSYSTKSFTEMIATRPNSFSTIHSLIPFVTVIWNLSDRFGIVTGLGANMAVNEKAYIILRNDGSEVYVVEPFFAKLTYQMGLIVRL